MTDRQTRFYVCSECQRIVETQTITAGLLSVTVPLAHSSEQDEYCDGEASEAIAAWGDL